MLRGWSLSFSTFSFLVSKISDYIINHRWNSDIFLSQSCDLEFSYLQISFAYDTSQEHSSLMQLLVFLSLSSPLRQVETPGELPRKLNFVNFR